MKALIKTLPLSLLAILAVGCGTQKPATDSTLASSSSSTYVDGFTKIRVIEKHDYISIQLTGEKLFNALYAYLTTQPTVEGEDGDYYAYKSSDEMSCGGSNTSYDGDPQWFEDPSCTINLSRAGKAGVVNDDPWAWAEAPIKSEDIWTSVRFKNGKASVQIMPSADTHLLWEALTGIESENDPDEEIEYKVGEDIRVDYEYADGDDFVGLFEISKKGLLTVE